LLLYQSCVATGMKNIVVNGIEIGAF
jgi:hypothetical protein